MGDDFIHLEEFKIVGGSFVVQEQAGVATQLETQRLNKWKATVGRIRLVPRSWRDRAKMLQATQSQATYCQGTHSLVEEVDELRKVRASVMKALWKTDFYSMSPLVTFAVLAPVQLDPEFGVIYEGM